jgi:hypothetical protein
VEQNKEQAGRAAGVGASANMCESFSREGKTFPVQTKLYPEEIAHPPQGARQEALGMSRRIKRSVKRVVTEGSVVQRQLFLVQPSARRRRRRCARRSEPFHNPQAQSMLIVASHLLRWPSTATPSALPSAESPELEELAAFYLY